MRTPFYTGHFHQVPKVSTIEGLHCIQDTSPSPQGVQGSTVYRTLHQVPKVSTIEGLHCIQDTSPGPQDRGFPTSTVIRSLGSKLSHVSRRPWRRAGSYVILARCVANLCSNGLRVCVCVCVCVNWIQISL